MSFNNQAQTLIEALSPTADKMGNKDFPKFAYLLLFAKRHLPFIFIKF
uniref:Uncharacterized protein n=1 Tax=Candidatus Methanophagaceae archaeon ANME-1 ERB6 TaxID=2759912 RepID=A0A7G9Z0V6_9EURY|nr:hypothetical protein LBDBNMAG_00025 [Methanosarcinales archaeon ANME-1 ERB6]